MEKLPKIIKDERGYLRVLLSEEQTILADSELKIIQNVGMKGRALVTCTFEADISEYKSKDNDYLLKQITDLKELVEYKDDEIKRLEAGIRWYKKPWYKKIF